MGGIEFSDVLGTYNKKRPCKQLNQNHSVISLHNFGEKSGFYPWFFLGRSHYLKCLGRNSFWGGIWSFLFYLGDSDFESKMEAVWRVSARTKSKMFLGIATKVDCFKIWGYFKFPLRKPSPLTLHLTAKMLCWCIKCLFKEGSLTIFVVRNSYIKNMNT